MKISPSTESSGYKEWLFTKEWANLVHDKLQRRDSVEIWCFRAGGIARKLCLAVYAERMENAELLLGNVEEVPQRKFPALKFPCNVMNEIRSIEGSNLVFVIAKRLDETDVGRGLNRLRVLESKPLLQKYLTEDETKQIEKQGKEGGLEVIVIDQRSVVYSLTMKMHPGCESSNYKEWVLTKEWAKLVRDKLQRGDLVEIWCFRVGRIRLAVYAERMDDVELLIGLC